MGVSIIYRFTLDGRSLGLLEQRVVIGIRFIVLMISLFISICLPVVAQSQMTASGAGRWFPSDPGKLSEMVGSFSKNALSERIDGRIVGAMSPHAGYVYSGKVAAFSFRAIRDNLRDSPELFVVIGPSHRSGFKGVALMEGDRFKTPLGEIFLDRDAADFLVKSSPYVFLRSAPHIGEHSVENQIPFIQTLFPSARLVAAVMGDHSNDTCVSLAEALVELSRKRKIVVIASSDMYHDPSHELVTRRDRATLEQIKNMNIGGLTDNWDASAQNLCGIGPVVTLMGFARLMGAKEGRVLHYRNSGDDFPEGRGKWVVGYCSVVFSVQGM